MNLFFVDLIKFKVQWYCGDAHSLAIDIPMNGVANLFT